MECASKIELILGEQGAYLTGAQFDAWTRVRQIYLNESVKANERIIEILDDYETSKHAPVQSVFGTFDNQAEKREVSTDHLLLANIEQKCVLLLAEEILNVLMGEQNVLTDAEKKYWLGRVEDLRIIGEADLRMLEAGVQFLEKREAVNALVPFVNKAHLN